MITAQKNIHILLIEDDPDDIELMESTLTLSNRRNTTQLKLTAFTSITAAFRTFHAHQYDVILLDLNLGRTMGLETLEEVTTRQQTLPIIVLTGLASNKVGLECIKHGASDYLIKRKLYTNQLVSNQFILKPIQYAIERNRLTQEIYHQKQKIEQSYEELQQLTFHASHDLKEPISTIIRFVQRFQHKYAGQFDEEAQQALDFILSQAHLQNKHIESLLRHITLEQESIPITTISLPPLLDKIIQQWTDKDADVSKMNITYQTIPSLNSNANYLTSILKELITNAIRFQDPQRKLQIVIQINKKPEQNGWLIQVQDNGQGLDMEYSKIIFEMFKTLQPKSRSNSVGAGLALVKKMVKQLKGKIWVESERGKGSTFFMELPDSL